MHRGSSSVCFPNEIYTEILQHLHYLRDRPMLLSIALVSQVLRRESQRVLFSNMDGKGGHKWRRIEDAIRIHTLFLQAVIDHPKRLGPYVVTYRQDLLACGPEVKNFNWEGPSLKLGKQLWELTRKALPEMVNLKYLFFRPRFNNPETSESLLRGCSFQLETLIWECGERTTEHLATFLLTQRRLIHFEFGSDPARADLGWLPGDACPTLMSTSSSVETIPTLTHRKIVALEVDFAMPDPRNYVPQKDNATILRHLKHLRVHGLILYFGFPGAVLVNVVLLDIKRWHTQNIECLASFPNLRALALRYNNDKYLLRVAVRRSFEQCPLLERVISHGVRNPSSHTTFTITRSDDDTQEEVKGQTTHYEHDSSRLWWHRYDV